MNYVTQWLSNDSNFRMGCGFNSQPIESNECNAREGRKRGVRIAFPARTCMFTEELKGKRQAGGRRRVDATGCGALPDRPLATTLPSHIHPYTPPVKAPSGRCSLSSLPYRRRSPLRCF